MRYHLDPEPAGLKHFLCDEDVQRVMEMGEGARSPMVFFVAGALETETEAIEPTVRYVVNECGDQARFLLAEALWGFQRHRPSNRWLKELQADASDTVADRIEKVFSTPAPNLRRMHLRAPNQLDWMWGYFSGSGDTTMVKRVIGGVMLGYGKDDKEGWEILVSGAAAWSLSSRMRKDIVVQETVWDHIENLSPEKERYLRQKLNV